ncbi:pyridoxal kinase [Futiania mangrovi]|uniref:pyridoxal kinase n=1 Tax=Futiania mangrovi TaxID=2959716 RepID=A0A9J6PE38_9PROT|nr:pyridoxal kinase [Futiania mangrovii]MCP1336670.1 pyridoxal kinase [Futiania mangrovii]
MAEPPVVLAISSHVVRGAVGLRIMVPCLEVLGHEVWALPTCVLSTHPGIARPVGHRTPAEEIEAIGETLDDDGALMRVRGVITGYFRDADQVRAAVRVVEQVKEANPQAIYMCDPVLGDADRGLYVSDATGAAIRDRLMPLADIATPNAFELSWLTGRSVTGPNEAEAAAREAGGAVVAVTSVPLAGRRIGTALVAPDTAHWVSSDRRPRVPRGTGDALSALLLGFMLKDMAGDKAMHRTVVGIETLIKAAGRRESLPTAGLAKLLGDIVA